MISEMLTKAKALISTPETWTQGVSVRDRYDRPVSSFSEHAYKFCLLGAIGRVDPGSVNRDLAISLLRKCVSTEDDVFELTAFNDNPLRKHSEVMALFDRAIEVAKKKELKNVQNP